MQLHNHYVNVYFMLFHFSGLEDELNREYIFSVGRKISLHDFFYFNTKQEFEV